MAEVILRVDLTLAIRLRRSLRLAIWVCYADTGAGAGQPRAVRGRTARSGEALGVALDEGQQLLFDLRRQVAPSADRFQDVLALGAHLVEQLALKAGHVVDRDGIQK